MTFEDLEQKVISWGIDKGITDAKAQVKKLAEEYNELASAIRNNDFVESVDGIGDMLVVLTMISHIIGTDLKHCYRSAYETIKNRKGKTINGIFIKEQ